MKPRSHIHRDVNGCSGRVHNYIVSQKNCVDCVKRTRPSDYLLYLRFEVQGASLINMRRIVNRQVSIAVQKSESNIFWEGIFLGINNAEESVFGLNRGFQAPREVFA